MGRSRNNFALWTGQANLQHSVDSSAERRLFVAVLSQAVHDAFSEHVPPYEKIQAQSWLMSNSKDFRDVCEHAGRNSGYVLTKIRRRILEKNGWNVNLTVSTTPPRHRRQMKQYRQKHKFLTGNAYYAAKREKNSSPSNNN